MKTYHDRLGPPQHLFRYVSSCLEKTTGKWGADRTTLFLQWPAIAGQEFADICHPSTLDKTRRGATLTVLANPEQAMELSYTGQELIRRINGYFGHSLVQRLRVLHQELPPSLQNKGRMIQPESSEQEITVYIQKYSDIKDDEMRQSLARLHATVERLR